MKYLILIVMVMASLAQAATVSVRDYGAAPGDGKDDADAFQRAIDAAGDGGVVNVPAGEYQVSRSIDPRRNRTILGQTQFACADWNATPLKFSLTRSSLIKPTGAFHAFKVTGSNLKFQALTIDGRGIWLDNGAAAIDQITIDGCWFACRIIGGDHRSAIQFQTWLTNSRITNNVFDGCDDVGVYGYYWSNLVIANNAFVNGNEGIHLINHDDRAKDLLCQQNYFGGLRRIAVEYQAGGWNSIVEDNHYESPSGFTASTMAYSLIADRSHGTIARRNTHISPRSSDAPDNIGVRIIFEAGGDGMLIEDNLSIGGNDFVAGNDFLGTSSVAVRNNRVIDNREPADGRGVIATNNGPNVQLTWSPSRGKPGPFRRLGEPPPLPAPDPTPPPATQPAPATQRIVIEGTNLKVTGP